MGFWDTLGGLFTGDTYFPDNPSREARAGELARDCQDYSAKLASLIETLQKKLLELNQDLAKLYGDPARMPEDVKPTDLKFNNVAFEVSGLIAPLVVAPSVSSALTVGATSYLLSTGEIGAAAFAELVGLPAAFEVAIGAAAGVAAIGISFAIGAISGAVKRDKLKDAIHEGYQARTKIAKAFLINSQLCSSIEAIRGALEALEEAGVSLEKIIGNIKDMVEKARLRADEVTDQGAQEYLLQLDRARGSWINEDA